MLDILLAIGISLLAVSGWAANLLGMPGNWLVVLLAGVAWTLIPEIYRSHVELPLCLGVLVVATIGEVLEFAASALGTSRLGGSKRGAALALAGSITGAIVGLFLGSPIPIVGNVIACLLLGGAGACAGAVLGERWAGKDWKASLEIGNAAFWGRILGTFGKAVCGTVAATLLSVAVWF